MSPFDKSRWLELEPLLDELLDLTPDQRRQRLQEIAAHSPDSAAELETLLNEQAAVAQEGFLDSSVIGSISPGLAGTTVDRYTIDRLLGEGGMGSVWLAHRSDGRYEGQVAIKFLSMPSVGSAGLQRFQREGQALARLKHPNIAHLLDAGMTAHGQPYLVIEYVQGMPIDVWCNERELHIKDRIELFLQVLSAVAHAHSKLILHRDLKPSNILVSDGAVKLLDFGIAKLLESETAVSEATQLAGRAFTVDYAAPEQIQGGEVTTATDVYSLGVLLYVLLTGEHPTAGNASTPAERLRALVDSEPKRPSVAVITTPNNRATPETQAIRARLLRGDLDNIIAKTLKKAPAERYPTIDAFAQDLQRYLEKRPVSARADSMTYRMRKFVARHAFAVTAGAVVITTVMIAAAVSLWQASEATRQRDRALQLSARNAAVVEFVSNMLIEVAPDDRPIEIAELLERSQQVLLGSHEDPEHQAAILEVLAEYYLTSGNPARAEPLLSRALELTENASDTALRATVICNNAYAMSLLNRRDEALAQLEQGIALSRVDPLASIRCLLRRAYVAQNANDPQAALDYAMQAQRTMRAASVRRPDQEASVLGDIAYAHYLSGRTAEADRYYAAAIESYTQLGRAESPSTFSLRNNWGIASFAAGDNQRALENYEAALRIARKRNPGGDPPTYLLSNRALALVSLARYEEALDAFEEALNIARRSDNSISMLHVLVNRAGTYLAMGEVDRAATELAMIEQQFGSSIPADSVPAITIAQLQGRIALERGNLADAIQRFDAVIAFFDQRQMQVAPVTRVLNSRAEARRRQGNFDAARRDATQALDLSRKLQDALPRSSLTGLSLLQLADIDAADGERKKSRETAREAAQHLTATLGSSHPDTLKALKHLED